jgi:hypothetical protein
VFLLNADDKTHRPLFSTAGRWTPETAATIGAEIAIVAGKHHRDDESHGDLVIWDVVQGKALLEMHDLRALVGAIHVSRDDTLVLVGCGADEILSWDRRTGAVTYRSFRRQEFLTALALSPDNRRIAIGTRNSGQGRSLVQLLTSE